MPSLPPRPPDHSSDAEGFDPPVLLMAAAEFAQAGKMDLAEATYVELVQQAPDFAIARFQLGLLQFTSARPTVALQTWGRLDQLPENHYLRSFKQAFAYLAEDQFETTVSLLREGMAQNQENPPLNRDMQMLLDRILQSGLLTGTPGTPGTGPNPDTPSTHFLLSSYRLPPT